MVFRGRESTIPLFELTKAEHNITSIGIVLKKFKVFVLKTINRWPIVKTVFTDYMQCSFIATVLCSAE